MTRSSILILLILGVLNLQAQQASKVPLRQVLQQLEQILPINFTYLDENVEGIMVEPPPANPKVEQVIPYLRSQTKLQYQMLDRGFIAISKKSPPSSGICGYLTDVENGERLVGATIRMGSQFTTSDDHGYFEIIPDGESIIIQHLGYEPQNLSLTDLGAGCSTILIKPQYTTLEEVVINNYLTSGINKIPDGSFQIQTQDLGILPGLIEPDVLQTIQALPGIQSTNETVSNINVRGGTHDQNLVLWEGIKMYKSGNFFGLISAFNPYITEDVTLIKNGTTAFLGDGVSSTIDLRTDNNISEDLSGGAGVNLISADAFVHLPISSKMSLQLAGRRSIADILETPTYDEYFDRAFRDTEVTSDSGGIVTTDENFVFYDVSLKWLYDPTDKDRIRVNFLNVFDDIQYRENALANDTLESKTSGLEQKNLAVSLNYQRQWNDRFKTSVLWYLSSYDLRAINFDIFNDRRLIQENEVLDAGIKVDAGWSINPQLYWNNGYQFIEIGVTNLEDISNPIFRRRIKKVLRSHSLFSELAWDNQQAGRNLRVGVRGNYIEELDEFYIEPRLSFNQNFLKHFTLELLGEIKSQTTTQIIDFQTDFLGVENRRWVLANNQNIPVLESWQVSAGLHFQKDEFLLSVVAYQKEVDGITTSSQGFQNQFEFVRSVGNYQTTGVDVLLNRRMGPVNAWASYSYAESDYEFPELSPSTFPNNFDIRHTATLGVSYQHDPLEISLGGNWRSGRPITVPQAVPVTDDAVNYDTPNNARLDDYLRVDISATYKFPLSNSVNGLVGISVWNLLDEENVVNNFFAVDNNNALEIQRSALGITPNVVFRITF